jgi:hypothetical protein
MQAPEIELRLKYVVSRLSLENNTRTARRLITMRAVRKFYPADFGNQRLRREIELVRYKKVVI